MPLDVKDETSIDNILGAVDMSLQYGEDLEVKVHVRVVGMCTCRCVNRISDIIMCKLYACLSM